MTTTGLGAMVAPTTPAPPRRRQRMSFGMFLIFFAVAIFLVSVIRILTGAEDLASSGTLAAAIGLAMPIGMAGLGGLWSERAGVVNIGLEGMMILGTWGAGFFGWQWGPWAGV